MSQSARTTTRIPTPETPVESRGKPWNPKITPLPVYRSSTAELPRVTVTVTDRLITEAEAKARKYDDWCGETDRPPRSMMLDAVLSEIAVAWYYGVKRDRNVYDDSGDGGVDIEINGMRVNVKARRYDPAYLLIPHYEPVEAGAYVVTDLSGVRPDATVEDLRGRTVTVRLWGWVPGGVVRATPVTYDGPRSDVADRVIRPARMHAVHASRADAVEHVWCEGYDLHKHYEQ